MLNQRRTGALLQYVQMGLSILISLIYTPIMLRTLGQGQYGIYSLAHNIISYLSLISLGFTASYIKFYTRYKKSNDQLGIKRLNGMFMIVFTVMSLVALASGLALSFNVSSFFTSEGYTPADMETAKILMIFMSVNMATTFPASVFNSYVTSQERFVFQKVLNIGKTVLSPMLTLPVLLMGYGSIGMVIVTTSVALIIDIYNALFCIIKLKMRFSFRRFNWKLLKEIALFSILIAINLVIDQINWNVDQLILAKMISKEAVAIYAIASTINGMYIAFSKATSSVFIPQIYRINASGDKDADKQLSAIFTKVGRVQYLILMLVLSGFVFFGKYFITMWAGEEYETSYYLTLLLIAPCTFALVQNVGIEIQRAKNKHHFRTYTYLAMAIINIGISILLCYYIGILGVAIGTAISLILANGLTMNIYYHKKCGINILSFWKSILRLSLGLIIPIAVGVPIMLFINYANVFEFIGWILLYVTVYCISMWFLGMNDYERGLVKSPIKKIFSKRKKVVIENVSDEPTDIDGNATQPTNVGSDNEVDKKTVEGNTNDTNKKETGLNDSQNSPENIDKSSEVKDYE